jgi:iron uptake system component EfeO
MNAMLSSRAWLAAAIGCGLYACSNATDDADYQAQATLQVKDYVGSELQKLTAATEALQKAAPDADDNGWNADADESAVDSMKKAWSQARDAYEHIEGAIAVLFPELDVSTDQRYDGFIAVQGDDDLFDDQGVTGVHAIERILWADSIPERVVKFESALEGYVAAAYPSNKDEADEFKNKLCQRLVDDVQMMRDQFGSLTALRSDTAFRGMIGSMKEQSEKTELAASGEDESRYAQRTLDDMRANLDGAKSVYNAFKPWIEASTQKSGDIQAGFDDISSAYADVQGSALPEVPEGFNPSRPSADDLATPYGKLWKLLVDKTDPENEDSLVSTMNAAADEMKIPLIPNE